MRFKRFKLPSATQHDYTIAAAVPNSGQLPSTQVELKQTSINRGVQGRWDCRKMCRSLQHAFHGEHGHALRILVAKPLTMMSSFAQCPLPSPSTEHPRSAQHARQSMQQRSDSTPLTAAALVDSATTFAPSSAHAAQHSRAGQNTQANTLCVETHMRIAALQPTFCDQ
jgi:hypothetical protein